VGLILNIFFVLLGDGLKRRPRHVILRDEKQKKGTAESNGSENMVCNISDVISFYISTEVALKLQ
jgi:hypothetical protein